jgi:hypothetical protein
LSVACVVVEAGVVVLVVVLLPEVVVLVVDPPDAGALVVVLPPLDDAAVVVVVAGGAGGATKGTVSPRMVASVAVGVGDKLVQLRAAFQLETAVVAGAPDSGWGTPSRMVAGRQTAPVMWRPCAVTTRVPLSVSGAVSS